MSAHTDFHTASRLLKERILLAKAQYHQQACTAEKEQFDAASQVLRRDLDAHFGGSIASLTYTIVSRTLWFCFCVWCVYACMACATACVVNRWRTRRLRAFVERRSARLALEEAAAAGGPSRPAVADRVARRQQQLARREEAVGPHRRLLRLHARAALAVALLLMAVLLGLRRLVRVAVPLLRAYWWSGRLALGWREVAALLLTPRLDPSRAVAGDAAPASGGLAAMFSPLFGLLSRGVDMYVLHLCGLSLLGAIFYLLQYSTQQMTAWLDMGAAAAPEDAAEDGGQRGATAPEATQQSLEAVAAAVQHLTHLVMSSPLLAEPHERRPPEPLAVSAAGDSESDHEAAAATTSTAEEGGEKAGVAGAAAAPEEEVMQKDAAF